MKKPKELTKEQWAKYKGDLDLALKVMNKALDVIADANFQAGEQVERERIIKLLMDRAFWLVHLDKLAEAEELKLQATVIKGEQK